MTSAPPTPAPPVGAPEPERHTAPALWVVVLGLVTAVVVAVTVDAGAAAGVLVAVLVGAAVARLIGRGRRPEGIAVRATWVDVLILLGLAIGVGALALAPGVR
ncbi:hypothetical protein GXB85_01250 [Cellulomonas sp. APG4]|uniref:hypothetical protein n=1 Tax=Cellulomonas sp. APG4 TaxID=1538656 RepID=UPI00137B81C8|nr:hypothetical protein [Cellulomonas sp. APG4]NCT89584.1 hypothetical protein [Cellulomonas sp. APG4]